MDIRAFATSVSFYAPYVFLAALSEHIMLNLERDSEIMITATVL